MSDTSPAGLLHDEAGVLRCFGVQDASELEDVLQFQGSVEFRPEGVELQMGREGTVLAYPFSADELHALSAELDPG